MNVYNEKLLHIDMYRLEHSTDLLHKWLLDAIDQHDYVVIEWPKRTEQYADEGRMQLLIEKKGDTRDVTLSLYKHLSP
jgi:tRNA A37 threonylcarbamoyladenosine biosynthesis protein TsaE